VRFFIDAEFDESGPGQPIRLISIAVVSERGPSYYAMTAEFDPAAVNAWVAANVLPQLAGETATELSVIGRGIAAFVEGECEGEAPEFWSAWGAYDWVVLCQTFGSMADLPVSWPMYCNDLIQWAAQLGVDPADLPGDGRGHHALTDARIHAEMWAYLDEVSRLRNHQRRLFFDDAWRVAMASALSRLIYERFDFINRFGAVATALAGTEGQGLQPGIVVGEKRHWFLRADSTVDSYSTAQPDDVDDIEAHIIPVASLDVHLDLDPADLEHWDMAAAAQTAAGELADQMWDRIADLLDQASVVASVDEARAELGPDDPVVIGPDAESVAAEAHLGVVDVPADVVDGVVLLAPGRLTVATWGLVTREYLDEAGWHLSGKARVAATLSGAGARRYEPVDSPSSG